MIMRKICCSLVAGALSLPCQAALPIQLSMTDFEAARLLCELCESKSMGKNQLCKNKIATSNPVDRHFKQITLAKMPHKKIELILQRDPQGSSIFDVLTLRHDHKKLTYLTKFVTSYLIAQNKLLLRATTAQNPQLIARYKKNIEAVRTVVEFAHLLAVESGDPITTNLLSFNF